MDYNAKWKVLEDLMLELKKKGCDIPPAVIADLRNAKLMIGIVGAPESKLDNVVKLDEILGGIEAALITKAQDCLSPREIDEWLRKIDDTSLPTRETKSRSENVFIAGVPRDQQWIRVEPMPNLPAERLTQIAKANSLSINTQKDGRLVVYGQQENIKSFLKKMIEEAQPK